jgi:formylglycine-generating enzyme required for sulfatase activity
MCLEIFLVKDCTTSGILWYNVGSVSARRPIWENDPHPRLLSKKGEGEQNTIYILGDLAVVRTATRSLDREWKWMTTETSRQTYKDFVLRIGRPDKGVYTVQAQGPAGEAQSSFRLPFEDRDIENFLLRVGRPRKAAVRGRVPEPVKQTVDFGNQLYQAVFTKDIQTIFSSARRDAQQDRYRLRFKLRLTDVPELADLPWEFLHDGQDFLALSADMSLVRYLDLPVAPRPLTADLPLKILFTVSSPHDLDRLDAEREQSMIRGALATMERDGLVEIRVETDLTLQTLQRVLRQAKRDGQPYRVWHHVGHGSVDPVTQSSVLMLCDRSGMSIPVGGFQLGTLFSNHPEIQLVLLSACEGARADVQDPFAGVATALVERGIPAVIGMQFEISNEAALTFGEEFYTALVDGMPIDTAVNEARRSVFFLPNWVEWATPVLYMRAPDGVLFDALRPRQGATEKRKDEIETPSQEVGKGESTQPDPEPPAAGDKAVTPEQPRETVPEVAPQRPEPEMVLIPGGEFLMGSDPHRDRDSRDWEQPQHTLYLPDYYMAKTPVTNAQYAAFLQATDYEAPESFRYRRTPPAGREEHPVVSVTWYDAIAYCQWLSAATGKAYRLPSEAEWEKGARGSDGRVYPWGNRANAAACHIGKGPKGSTAPVNAYPEGASPYGLLGMAGNVWEWTITLAYDSSFPEPEYPYESGDGRENLVSSGDSLRVVRGGAFFNYLTDARCASRSYHNPHSPPSAHMGFRVVISTYPSISVVGEAPSGTFHSYMKKQLAEYIAGDRRKGIGDEAIRATLLSAGHQAKTIDEAFVRSISLNPS